MLLNEKGNILFKFWFGNRFSVLDSFNVNNKDTQPTTFDIVLVSCESSILIVAINPLQPGVAFLYPLKTSENLKVFLCFQGYSKATMGFDGLSIYLYSPKTTEKLSFWLSLRQWKLC